MKIKFFSILAFAGALLSSCAVDEIPAGGGYVCAEMENDDTRTAVTDEGRFTWSAGDRIWLHTTNGSVVGTLSSGAETSNANFAYGPFIGDMTGKAVYPYDSGHFIDGFELNVVLPASYELGSNLGNTNAVMYGVDVDGTIKFNHLAGVMRFVFKNAPAGTDRFTITLDKKINGTFSADITASFPVIKTEATDVESEKTVTLDFNALASASDIKLYIPIPVGVYESLELSLYAGDQIVWTYSNNVTNTVDRKTLKLMPTVNLGGVIGGEIEDTEGSDGFDAVVPKPADNEIWYTTTDGKVAEVSSWVYCESNQYDEEKGVCVITFGSRLSNVMGEGFFSGGHSRIKTIQLPECITAIDYYAFESCTALEEINLPDGLKTIGDSAFAGCTSLKEVTIPSSVTSIGNCAFGGCSGEFIINCNMGDYNSTTSPFRNSMITSVSFGDGVTEIGDHALNTDNFSGGSFTLKHVPEGVTRIGDWNLYFTHGQAVLPSTLVTLGSENLHHSIYFKGTVPPSIGQSEAGGNIIYVPASSDDSIINAYKSVLAESVAGGSYSVLEYEF